RSSILARVRDKRTLVMDCDVRRVRIELASMRTLDRAGNLPMQIRKALTGKIGSQHFWNDGVSKPIVLRPRGLHHQARGDSLIERLAELFFGKFAHLQQDRELKFVAYH